MRSRPDAKRARLLLALFLGLAPTGHAVRAQTADPGPAPQAPVLPDPASEGRLLVLSRSEDSLLILDVPSYKRLATLAVGKEPHEVVATPDGRKAYVSNLREGSISVIDLNAQRVARTLRSDRFASPHGLAVSSDGRRLLLTSEGNRRFFLIDTERDVVLRSVTTTQARSHMVTIGEGGGKAFVANVDSDSVSILRLPEMRLVKHLKVGDGPEGIDATPNGKWVLVALQHADQVDILDAGSGAILARLPAGHQPTRVAVTPNSFGALVTNRGSNDVTVLDILSRRVKTTVPVGQKPGGVTTNAQGTRAYVCNDESNTVSVLSIPGYEVVQTIPVGAHPDGIAFVPRAEPSGKRRGRPS